MPIAKELSTSCSKSRQADPKAAHVHVVMHKLGTSCSSKSFFLKFARQASPVSSTFCRQRSLSRFPRAKCITPCIVALIIFFAGHNHLLIVFTSSSCLGGA